MKYEKAVAEVIEFGPTVNFMTTSGGNTGSQVLVSISGDSYTCKVVDPPKEIHSCEQVYSYRCQDVDPDTYYDIYVHIP